MIRTFRTDDISKLGFAVRLSARPETRLMHPDWESLTQARIELTADLPEPEEQFLVCEKGDEVLGFGGLAGRVDPSGEDMSSVSLYGPVVRPDARGGRRVGRRLMKALLALARERFGKNRAVSSFVAPENRAALRRLARFRFKKEFGIWSLRQEERPEFGPPPEGCRVYRSGTLEDARAVHAIYCSCWSGRKTAESFALDVQRPPSGLFILERDADPIGFFQYIASPTGRGRIEYFAIHPECQGQGYGNVLLSEALRIIWENPALRYLDIATHSDNEPAKRLYMGLGFRKRFDLAAFVRRP